MQGSSDDEGVLSRALEGAEALFLIVPPSFKTTDSREHYLQFTRPACRAIQRRGAGRIVTVSGVGRRARVEAGPVSASFGKDAEIERSGIPFRTLWCPGFMENTLRSVGTIREQGAIFGVSRADVKLPMVATRDIAAVAARLLLDRSWSGPGGAAVLGPKDLSPNDMAAILSDVLGKPVRYQPVPAEAYKAQLMKFGASEHFAQGLIDMHVAKDEGLDHSEPRTADNTTPTTYRQWCLEVLKPAMAG